MFEFFVSFFQMIFDGIQHILDFLSSGIYKLLKQLVLYYIEVTATVFFIKLKFAAEIMGELWDKYFSQHMGDFAIEASRAWGRLPPEIKQAVSFFKIPDCVNILLSALSLRILRILIPFL